MKIVYKGIMRQSIVNIINYTKIGQDALPGESVPIPNGIQMLQRNILYSGVLTKNSKKATYKGPAGDWSEACKEIITSLQKIKDDPRMSKDTCMIQQDKFKIWLEKQGEKIEKSFHVLPRFLAKDELEEYNLGLERKAEARRLYSKATTFASQGIRSRGKVTSPTSEQGSMPADSQLGNKKKFSNDYKVNLMKCLIEDSEYPQPDFQHEVVLETKKKKQTNSCLKGVKIFSKFHTCFLILTYFFHHIDYQDVHAKAYKHDLQIVKDKEERLSLVQRQVENTEISKDLIKMAMQINQQKI